MTPLAAVSMGLAVLAAGSGFSSVFAHHTLSISPPKALLAACARPDWEDPELSAVPLPDGWRPARRLFLNGVCALRGHLPEKAIQELKKGLAGQPGVPYIWRWYLLNALVDAGEHDEAVLEFSRFLREKPPSILLTRSRRLLSALLTKTPALPYETKAGYLLTYIAGKKIGPGDYELIRHWYRISSRTRNEWLRWKLAALMWSHPSNARAVRKWAKFPAQKMARGLGRPTDRGYLLRARRMYRLRQYSRVLGEFHPYKLPRLKPRTARSVGRLYIRALIRKRYYQRGVFYLQDRRLLKAFSFSQRQSLIWSIRIQHRRRNIGTVLKHLKTLERISPGDGALPGIFLDLVKYNYGRRNPVTTTYWLKRLSRDFPRAQESSDAHWFVIWGNIAKKRYARAAALIEDTLKSGILFHPVDHARLYYWKGRLKISRGELRGGKTAWRELQERWPYGYYAEMAEFIGNGASLNMKTGRNVRVDKPEPYPRISALWDHPPFPQALFLFSVGENSLASQLLKRVVARRLPKPVVEEASRLFSYLDNPYLQLLLMARHKLKIMRRSRVTDSPLWRQAFPLAYWETVRRQSDTLGVDPYAVMAVMREESRFFTAADSTAGARGLMQLMPATAREIAQQRGIKFDETKLNSPEVSIELGAYYLRQMIRRFKGNLFLAAAAYNAGPTTARKWRRLYGHLPVDHFVERIPIQETKLYVKRVFLSFMTYQKIYQ
ncbi:MAG: lytic transglycosylase domain-containing protein [bacterium]